MTGVLSDSRGEPKYLTMICRGHVPVWGRRVNQDIAQFIRYFLPKGSPATPQTTQTAVRHLHLAFKGMETEEIYDVMMAQLIRAIAKYDPNYTDKVKEVVEAINEQLSEREDICLVDVNRHVEFDRIAISACCAAVVTSRRSWADRKTIRSFEVPDPLQ